ncbi:MAG: hypothetical protein ACK5LY_02645 [Lachnospirales bacterium]
MDRSNFLELCELYLKTYKLTDQERVDIYNSIIDLYDNTIPSFGSEETATNIIGEPKILVKTFVDKFLESKGETYDDDFYDYKETKVYNEEKPRKKNNVFLNICKYTILIAILFCFFPFVLGWFGILVGFLIADVILLCLPIIYILFSFFDSFVFFEFFLCILITGLSFICFPIIIFLFKGSYKFCTKFFSFFKN